MTLNGAELHLAINHFPVVGFFLTAVFFAFGLARNDERIKDLSLAFFIFFALVGIPTYLTGDPAAGVIRHLPDTNKLFVKNHSQAAFLALILMEILGAGSLLVLVSRKKRTLNVFMPGLFVFSVMTAIWLFWTANLGGQIRHIEIRSGFKVDKMSVPERSKPPSQRS